MLKNPKDTDWSLQSKVLCLLVLTALSQGSANVRKNWFSFTNDQCSSATCLFPKGVFILYPQLLSLLKLSHMFYLDSIVVSIPFKIMILNSKQGFFFKQESSSKAIHIGLCRIAPQNMSSCCVCFDIH